MIIKNKFLYFTSLTNFQNRLNAGDISSGSIAFINDGSSRRIWTQGTYFFCDINGTSPIGGGSSDIVVLDVLDSSSEYPVQSKVLYDIINNLWSAINSINIPEGTIATQAWVNEQIEGIINIDPTILQTIQQLQEYLENDEDLAQSLLEQISQKANASDVYTKEQINAIIAAVPAINAYTKTEADNIFLTKAEYYNATNPITVTVRVNPSIAIYENSSITTIITYTVKQGSFAYLPDSINISVNETQLGTYTGVSSGSVEYEVNDTGNYNITVEAIKSGMSIAPANTVLKVVKPTYIGYSLSSTYQELNIADLTKYSQTSPTVSNLELINNTQNVHLWIVSPYYNSNIQVANDSGGTFTVDMVKIGTYNGLNYWRSVQKLDICTLQYWIRES